MVHTRPDAISVVDPKHSLHDGEAPAPAPGLDAGTVGFLVALDGNIHDGLLGETTGDLARLIGRPTTPLSEGLRAGR